MRMIKKNRIKKYLLLSGVFDEFLNLLFSKLKKKQTQKILIFWLIWRITVIYLHSQTEKNNFSGRIISVQIRIFLF